MATPRPAELVFPPSHLDLVDGPFATALTTRMPDGRLQTTPIWCNRGDEGDCILINTMRGFRKERNMRLDPRVSLLLYDLSRPLHNLEIRGVVEEITEMGGVEHLDALTRLYLNKPDAHFFGDSVPVELSKTYVPVKIRIRPLRVRSNDSSALNSANPTHVAAAHALQVVSAVTIVLPDSHRDLFECPVHGVLATLMPDGQPQSSIVWVDYDGSYVLINTTMERQKGRNMQADPRVSLLVIDPANGSRWIEVRGIVATIQRQGAEAHADRLAQRYSGGEKQRFYGDVYPEARREQETRVIVKIAPQKVALDAIFR